MATTRQGNYCRGPIQHNNKLYDEPRNGGGGGGGSSGGAIGISIRSPVLLHIETPLDFCGFSAELAL